MAILLGDARPASQGQAGHYTIISTDGRRTLPFRTATASTWCRSISWRACSASKVTEDTLAGGLLIETRGQRILAVPGQSFVKVAGRVVQLVGPDQRERNVLARAGRLSCRSRSARRSASASWSGGRRA